MSDYVKTQCYSCTNEYDDAGYGLFMCISGMVYGPCSYEECGGVCEAYGTCECTCHE